MRKSIVTKAVSVATVAALTLGAFPAVADAQDKIGKISEEITTGIERGIDPEKSVLQENSSTKDFFKNGLEPFGDMSSMDTATSSQGVTRTIINYVIIAAGITIIGQIIQLVMANMPR